MAILMYIGCVIAFEEVCTIGVDESDERKPKPFSHSDQQQFCIDQAVYYNLAGSRMPICSQSWYHGKQLNIRKP